MLVGFRQQRQWLRRFGGRVSDDGQFRSVLGIAVDKQSNWVASDYKNHRVNVFSREGSFITTVTFGGPEQFNNPQGVCVDDEGRILVADDNYHVLAFGF